ncbi:intracellular protein transport protein [Lasallia pustulata]|uniref:Intracellular protein transport protein n=1 Tax=Lasallia pustulata TaxID=136370 RepID=A0A1W5D3G9_9LECA|nr:intracellular protein transport protein [Lasallia pustulata]
MFRILEAQAPAKQTATDTINTLSSRLQSATLLEDRRAAILGLRSFAKSYPASVASGALRGLISSLGKDAEDVDTAKVILETLLMLFNPDESSPEASDDIALWLADEFTQRQDNITVLLDLLDNRDFYSRLYSLQLISAISTARPERTQECVYTAPLGVSRLVSVLDDKREAVRSEGLLLLIALTPSSPDLQKLVAFENAFDHIFSIIDADGSLTHGGLTVQHCLSFLANLLRLNVSNQSYFRETGWVAKLSKLLGDVLREQDSPDGVAEWVQPQRDKNVWGLLAVLRLFLGKGGLGTQANQLSFWQNGLLVHVLNIAFHRSFDNAIRAEAFLTCADVIRGNSLLQEGFAQRSVDPSRGLQSVPQVNGHSQNEPAHKVNVIQGLLELVLATSSSEEFDVRLAACKCIKAYLYGHAPIRLHFLRRAIDGHISDDNEIDNIFTILIDNSGSAPAGDPYRPWMAAVILFHLLYEDSDAKAIARGVTEGDAESGEEVVTCIQALSANLIAAVQRSDNERVSIGYLMVLCAWLFEEPDAVNDFLGEGSNVQSLVQLITQDTHRKVLVTGLCAYLLGIIYEFSTKDSPVPRATLHQILTMRLGREQYTDQITKLREHTLVRDFEVLPQRLDSSKSGGLPDVYFDSTFVEFLKDNFSRVVRAVDRDPGIEIPVIANGIQRGVSRELVDSLRVQAEDRIQALHRAESELLNLEQKLGQEQADHRKAKEFAALELGRIKSVNEALQRNHEEEVQNINEENRRTHFELQSVHEKLMKSLSDEMRRAKDDSEAASAKTRSRHDAEMEDLKKTVRDLENELQKSNRDHVQDLQTAHEEYSLKLSTLESRLERAEDKADDAEARARASEAKIEEAESKARKALEALDAKEEARTSVQTELDDLLMVLADVEEKRARDKKRLKALGEQISDAEDGSDAEDDDDRGEADEIENVH